MRESELGRKRMRAEGNGSTLAHPKERPRRGGRMWGSGSVGSIGGCCLSAVKGREAVGEGGHEKRPPRAAREKDGGRWGGRLGRGQGREEERGRGIGPCRPKGEERGEKRNSIFPFSKIIFQTHFSNEI